MTKYQFLSQTHSRLQFRYISKWNQINRYSPSCSLYSQSQSFNFCCMIFFSQRNSKHAIIRHGLINMVIWLCTGYVYLIYLLLNSVFYCKCKKKACKLSWKTSHTLNMYSLCLHNKANILPQQNLYIATAPPFYITIHACTLNKERAIYMYLQTE